MFRKLRADVAAIRRHQSQATVLLQGVAKNGRPTWGDRLTAVCAVVSVLVTAATLWFVVDQTSAIASQAESAARALHGQSRADDMSFLAGVSSSITDAGLRIENTGEQMLTPFAYWYLSRDSTANRISEVEGLVAGIPSCSAITVPWHVVGGEAETRDDTASQQEELHLALQVPSGAWYLLGTHGTLSLIEHPDAGEPYADPPRVPTEPYQHPGDALEALQRSRHHLLAADTYWEGADSVGSSTAEPVELPDNLVRGNLGAVVYPESLDCG